MTQPPPLPPLALEYRGQPEPPPRDPHAARKFAYGLFTGIAVSAIAYFGGGLISADSIIVLGLIIAAVKTIAGITCVCIQRRRMFGAGLLTSLPVGFMIFFGACATFWQGIGK